MKIGRIAVIAIVAGLIAAAAPAVFACAAPYQFSTWGTGTTYVYNYVNLGPAATSTIGTNGIVGRFWGAGNRAGFNEGNNAVGGWFFPFPDHRADAWYINGGMAAGENGCSSGNLVTLVQTTTTDGRSSKFAVGTVPANLASGIVWDYSTLGPGDWNMVEVANPGVTYVGKTGSVVTLNVTFPNLQSGSVGGSLVTGYRLVRSAAAGVPAGVDVGRAAAAWTLVQQVTPGSSINGLTFDCATLAAGQDLFLAVQPVFDGGQFNGDYVGKSTQVKCNSTQADPQFRKIDKTPKH